MNVREDGLKEYIETFYSTLCETSDKYLPQEFRSKLLHLSFLPAHVIGYTSTQYGVAIEYEPTDETVIEIKRGSARVEDLLIQAPTRLRNVGPMINVSASNVGIFNLTLSGGFPFRLNGREASLSIGNVKFEAGGWNRSVTYAEIYSNREKENWSKEKAIYRAKDEVLSALVELKRSESKNVSIAEYIATYKEKTVLILGDYDSEGQKRLSKIAGVVKKLGYEPLLVKDIPDNPYHDIPQKVVAVGAIARFVIIDDSSKSGHLMEVGICKQNNWATILLRAEGKAGSWVTAGASHHSKVILEKDYDLSTPEFAIKEAVDWVEKKLEELKKEFENTYPWRNINS